MDMKLSTLSAVEAALRLAGSTIEQARLKGVSLSGNETEFIQSVRKQADEFPLSKTYQFAVELEGAEIVRRTLKKKLFKFSLLSEHLIIVAVMFASILGCANNKYYTVHNTPHGLVQCPDASRIDNPTDSLLAALVKPQTEEAIEYCEGY